MGQIRAAEPGEVPEGIGPGPRPEPGGIVEVSASGPGVGERGPEGVYYWVFRTAAEAEEEYSASGGFAYALIPRTIAHRAKCTSIGATNGCFALAGNVLVVAVAKDIVPDIPGLNDRDEVALDALALAKGGTEHLEAVRTRLARQPRAPARAPVQLPSR